MHVKLKRGGENQWKMANLQKEKKKEKKFHIYS